MNRLLRILALLLCLGLVATACGADSGGDTNDLVEETAPVATVGAADEFDDEDFDADEDFDDDEDLSDDEFDNEGGDEFDDEGLDGPEADDESIADVTESTDDPVEGSESEAFCAANPDAEECIDYFNNLSDAQYCSVLPNDIFCDGVSDDERGIGDEQLQVVTGPGSIAVAGVNPVATRSDGLCLPDEGADTDQSGVEFNLAYQVVDGELGAICFGSPDETVEQAWKVLTHLTPPDQLRDLAVFAGFESTEQDNVTLAFVQGLNDDGTDYLMAVNIAETQNDWDEATLTMAHEFTHVFTALPSELDRTIDAEGCPTFDNGEGCYASESIMNQWFETFWQSAPGDPTVEADSEQRCNVDSGFFGNYAASTPEEDFAESFSAYVLRVEPRTEGQGARLDWIDQQAGLQEFKARAVELNYGPLAHNFDSCG